MTEAIRILLLGEARGKGRPRVTRSGHVYTPSRTVAAEARLALAAQAVMAGRAPLTDAVRVEVVINVAIPRSWSIRRKAAALKGEVRPTTRPDLDNTLKLLFDAFNHIVFLDDRQVVEVAATKCYAPGGGGTVVVITPIEAVAP